MTNSTDLTTIDLSLEPMNNDRLANLSGPLDKHLRQIEVRLGLELINRGNLFQIVGERRTVRSAAKLIKNLYKLTESETLSSQSVHLYLQESGVNQLAEDEEIADEVCIKTKRGIVKGRGPNQCRYLKNISGCDINFGVGPAGTGKTYLAVASAVEALQSERVQRLILVRPAVEAGEKLGFLPGDLSQKVDPYLRPLYDALYEMLGFDRVAKLMERNIIEVAPLAYMRGRSLNDSFIILDEAQNTTVEQMKMFLTRIGFGSTAVITGDITQIDLPGKINSGLRHVLKVLSDVNDVSFAFLTAQDVVRHPLVKKIILAYEKYEAQ